MTAFRACRGIPTTPCDQHPRNHPTFPVIPSDSRGIPTTPCDQHPRHHPAFPVIPSDSRGIPTTPCNQHPRNPPTFPVTPRQSLGMTWIRWHGTNVYKTSLTEYWVGGIPFRAMPGHDQGKNQVIPMFRDGRRHRKPSPNRVIAAETVIAQDSFERNTPPASDRPSVLTGSPTLDKSEQ